MLVGDAGMGKTRLLAEMADMLSGRRVLRLVGYEPERHVPLGAALPVLRDLGSRGPDEVRLQELLTASEPELGGLEPVRVFETAYGVLRGLSDSVILIDDLQWLDELSRALAHYLLRAALADGVGLLMVCAMRPTPESVAFVRSMSDLFGDSDRYAELPLGPLARTEGAQLAQMLRPGLSTERAQAIWSAAGGSPFWIELAVRAGADPDNQSAAIPALLRALSTDAVACLAVVVVGARPVEPVELGEVLAWPAERVAAAVSELVNRGVVSSHAGMCRTAHDLVREAALKQLPPDEVRRIHRRYAETLRHRADGDLHVLMEALEHEGAGGAATSGLALEIAGSPQRRLLGQSGLDRLSVIAQAPSPDSTETLALNVELAALAEELGDHESALARLTNLSELLPTRGERAATALRAARHALELSRPAEMAALLARVRRDGGDDPWTQVGADALDFDRLAWLEHDARAAEPYRKAAITAARDLVAQAGSLEVLTGTARQAYAEAVDAERVAYLMADDITEMLVVSDELVEATRGMGERHLDARLATCMALRFLNRWPESEIRVTAVKQEARQQVSPGIAAYAAYQLALVVYHLGRVAEAGHLHEEARRLGARVDAAFDGSDTWLCGLRQLIEVSAGDWKAALASLRQEASRQDNPHCRLILSQRAALWSARFAADDSHDLVMELIDSALADAGAADCVRCTSELQLVAAEALARVGELTPARDLLTAWDLEQQAPQARARFVRDRAGAVLAAVEHNDEAPALLQGVIASAAAASTRLEELWGLIDLGAVLVGRDAAEAVEVWSAASRMAAELGATSELALVSQRLRDVGVRRVGRPRRAAHDDTPVGRLSRRELEVARLAARGTRNADIAQTLFISAKTVEQHVSQVFAKLAVHNRAELAARYADQLDTAADSPEK